MTWITADFPALSKAANSRIGAGCTTRQGGLSTVPFDSLNLAKHVNDVEQIVEQNRALLAAKLQLPSKPYWLQQTHTNRAVELPSEYKATEDCDASFTKHANIVCAVMTADCLPLLVVNSQATEVAAIHAGWRGLADGIIEHTINRMASANDDLHVWLGPSIGPTAFEVGEDVRQKFISLSDSFVSCFEVMLQPGKYLADLPKLAQLKLRALGVQHVAGGEYCTYNDEERFYSYRRDGETGRMASLIWIK